MISRSDTASGPSAAIICCDPSRRSTWDGSLPTRSKWIRGNRRGSRRASSAWPGHMRRGSRIWFPDGGGQTASTRNSPPIGQEENKMWNQVGQALSQSMNRMLNQMASLLPGVIALIAALLVSGLVAWILAAILQRSLIGFDFDRRVAQWGFPALAE